MIYEEIAQALVDGEGERVIALVERALDSEGKPPEEIIQQGLAKGMERLGELYELGERFLVDLIVASDAFKKSIEIIKPRLAKMASCEKFSNTVVIGTVEGDIHEIGKKLVGVMLEVEGFQVIDLGPDVSPERFSIEVKRNCAKILGMSSLITTTMINAERTIKKLEEDNIRNRIKIMIGGAPVDEEFVKRIGGDAYGKDAFEAATVAKTIIISEDRSLS